MTLDAVREIVDDYVTVFPDEITKLGILRERLKVDEQFNHRKSFSGHGTAGAIVLSPDLKKVLLIHHNFLGKWLQPGGHWDPEDPNPWTVALREAEEEASVVMDRQLNIDPDRPHIPVDIDSHHIPANAKKEEPEHYHHDFRYAFVAASEDIQLQELEVSGAEWIPIDAEDSRLVEVWPSLVKLREFGLIA